MVILMKFECTQKYKLQLTAKQVHDAFAYVAGITYDTHLAPITRFLILFTIIQNAVHIRTI